MTGEADVSPSPSQRPLQQRSSNARTCRARIELGKACVIPADEATGWCSQHDPAKADALRLRATMAARTSHSSRALKLFGPEWERPDFTTSEARVRFREEVALARGRGDLDDKAAVTLLRACDGAMADDQTKGTRPPPVPLVVEVQRFGENGASANGHDAHDEAGP